MTLPTSGSRVRISFFAHMSGKGTHGRRAALPAPIHAEKVYEETDQPRGIPTFPVGGAWLTTLQSAPHYIAV